ncbi:MAG TPA: ribosome-associated translation inhibitor RaiA [Natronosporangium sp.]
MEIVVKGRNVEVPEHFRVHVAEKLNRAVRFDPKIIEIDVELLHERNPRQQDHCQRVEITCVSRGPVVRAEACGRDFYTALDEAITKLTARLRRAADRRRVHRSKRARVSVAAATANLPTDLPGQRASEELATEPDSDEFELGAAAEAVAQAEYDEQPWHIVREKEHPGDPMTVADALFHMELLGHDFYLFNDKESGRPSVVYRRRAYDYGVISLAEPAS